MQVLVLSLQKYYFFPPFSWSKGRKKCFIKSKYTNFVSSSCLVGTENLLLRMKKINIVLFGLLLAIAIVACRNSRGNIDGEPQVVVPVYKDMAVFALLDSTARDAVLEKDSTEIKAFLSTVSEQPFSPQLVEAWSTSLPVEMFTPKVDSIFPSVEPLARDLGNILARADAAGLKLPERKYAAVVYGRPESVLFVDDIMLIALNHYLGADFEGYSHWPSFIRVGKTPQMLPYDLAEAMIGTSYPYESQEDATVLDRMLYEGALAHAKIRLAADGNEAMALGYLPEQWQWLEENEKELWNTAVKHQLIFDTSEQTSQRLFAPSPATTLLAPMCPGRAGRYLGYKIVESYLAKHPDAALPFLLSRDFYASPSSLELSAY